MSTELNENVESHLSTITFNAILRLRQELEANNISQAKLAEAISKSPGRVSQVFNPDRPMTLKQMVKVARAMGLKASVVFYDDGDKEDRFGPLNPGIFESCWIECNKPVRMGQISASATNAGMKNIVNFSVHATTTTSGDTFYATKDTAPIRLQGTC